MVIDNEPDNICMYASHIYGVSKSCALLAVKRNLNAELAVVCGMLHDIGYMAGGSSETHAIEGAKRAETLLKEIKSYDDNEMKLITAAIANHRDKCTIHDEYDELLKDACVMDHCFYSYDSPISEWEIEESGMNWST